MNEQKWEIRFSISATVESFLIFWQDQTQTLPLKILPTSPVTGVRGSVLDCLIFQYKLSASPTPSDEEEESSDEEGDTFGPKKEKVEEDPVKSEPRVAPAWLLSIFLISGAKQMAETAMKDPVAAVNNLKFWWWQRNIQINIQLGGFLLILDQFAMIMGFTPRTTLTL